MDVTVRTIQKLEPKPIARRKPDRTSQLLRLAIPDLPEAIAAGFPVNRRLRLLELVLRSIEQPRGQL